MAPLLCPAVPKLRDLALHRLASERSFEVSLAEILDEFNESYCMDSPLRRLNKEFLSIFAYETLFSHRCCKVTSNVCREAGPILTSLQIDTGTAFGKTGLLVVQSSWGVFSDHEAKYQLEIYARIPLSRKIMERALRAIFQEGLLRSEMIDVLKNCEKCHHRVLMAAKISHHLCLDEEYGEVLCVNHPSEYQCARSTAESVECHGYRLDVWTLDNFVRGILWLTSETLVHFRKEVTWLCLKSVEGTYDKFLQGTFPRGTYQCERAPLCLCHPCRFFRDRVVRRRGFRENFRDKESGPYSGSPYRVYDRNLISPKWKL